MPRVVGVDPGTQSFDLCGLDDGRVFLEASIPTDAARRNPSALVERLEAALPLDLIAAPSGYGLPLLPVAAILWVFTCAAREETGAAEFLAPPPTHVDQDGVVRRFNNFKLTITGQ